MQRKYKIGVMGSAREPEDSDVGRLCYDVGKQVASHGAILLTGGCPGLPHAAALGAKQTGGMTVAISPAMNRHSHLSDFGYPLDSEVIIFTGMGNKGRNVILVRSCDACIFVSGGMGTLNEFTIAFDDFCESNTIGILTQSGGLSDSYLNIATCSKRKTLATIVSHTNPESLVKSIVDDLTKQRTTDDRC